MLDHLGPPGEDVEAGVRLEVQDPFWVQVLQRLLQNQSEQNMVIKKLTSPFSIHTHYARVLSTSFLGWLLGETFVGQTSGRPLRLMTLTVF